MKIKKIIIIDDELDYINEIAEFLTKDGFEIIKKTNTLLIINFIKIHKPDLIILDMKINGLTGIDVAKLLKSDVKTNGLPIILLTNYYNDYENDFTKDKIKFGINLCMKKTISPDILISEIRKLEKVS